MRLGGGSKAKRLASHCGSLRFASSPNSELRVATMAAWLGVDFRMHCLREVTFFDNSGLDEDSSSVWYTYPDIFLSGVNIGGQWMASVGGVRNFAFEVRANSGWTQNSDRCGILPVCPHGGHWSFLFG